VERLANSLRAALKDPILVQRYTEMGAIIAPPNTVNPDYLKSFLRADVDKWKVAMKNANIQPE
jgi:tripartite-type tricarboxylate transporter receptor subunit TctC